MTLGAAAVIVIPMYIERVPNRNSPPAVLLRSSHWDRERRKVRKVTHANLSGLPDDVVDAFAAVLKGGVVVSRDSRQVRVLDSRPWGAIAAVLGLARKLRIPGLLHSRHSRKRDLALALIVLRLLEPGSRLAAARKLGPQGEMACLNEALGLGSVSEQQLYDTLDWLTGRQATIETKLARRHLKEGCLALYDLTSVWYTGEKCELARRGYSRDGKRGNLQILVGLLCDAEGRPVSAEVFAGNHADPRTVPSQVDKLRRRFGFRRVVLVGDRGMLTEARIREDLAPHDLGWITALRAPAIRRLVKRKHLDPDQVEDWQLAEIESTEYPGERLIVCRNPRLRVKRQRHRDELLAATEAELERIREAAGRKIRPLAGDALVFRTKEVLKRYKMGKHLRVQYGAGTVTWRRNQDSLAAESALDGLYVLRAKVRPEEMTNPDLVRAYKSLATVERAFRHLKTVDLEIRPIYLRHPDRVRAHTLLCALSYYVEWHMRRQLAPLLYGEEVPVAAERARSSPVAPAQPSSATAAKQRSRPTPEGEKLRDFRGLLGELRSLQRSLVSLQLSGQSEEPEPPAIRLLTEPGLLQQRAFDLLQLPIREKLPSTTTSDSAE